MLTFNRRYFTLALSFLTVEILIALFVNDTFIRPYVGDFLVVFLVYFTVRTFIKASPFKIAIGVLFFVYFVEMLQYFKTIDRLGLSGNPFAKTVLGHGFEWWDIVAYTLGVLTILILEWFINPTPFVSRKDAKEAIN
jgi:Protein of unknown function (DUF2809)